MWDKDKLYMGTLSEAPLIEAIFEMRWGKLQKPVGFQFPPDDVDFFPGQFRNVAISYEFRHIEEINKGLPGIIPHIVRYRFRKAENLWPCYQIGLGVFTVNQVNEGYNWETFRGSVLQGLRILNEGHPVGLERLPGFGIEMRYQDGFLFDKGETPLNFLSDKLNINFGLVKEFYEFPSITKDVRDHKIEFNIHVVKPKGILIISLMEGLINGQAGFIMNTIVRSFEESMPAFTIDSIENWLEEAHNIQRHTFKTLINPTYAKSFK